MYIRTIALIFLAAASGPGWVFASEKAAPEAMETARAIIPPVAPPMSRGEIAAGLLARDRALFLRNDWIRDPYIVLGPDGWYYLTGTTMSANDPREKEDPYNVGLGDQSAVGDTVRLWKSKDLIDWDYAGEIFDLARDTAHGRKPGQHVWAPEIHWVPEMRRWALLLCPMKYSTLALSAGEEPSGPWTHPMGTAFTGHHDPSLHRDGGTWWVLSGNTRVRPLSPDFKGFTAPAKRIDPSGTRQNATGKAISAIGHEGATMIRVGKYFVHLGTAWSTDQMRKGSYNLYYCVSDRIEGPYGPRRFAGRFLGHGTPFQTREGHWWCTAFFNADVPPLPREGIKNRNLSESAQTINQRGTTIVPLDVGVDALGMAFVRARDPAYAVPGPDEVQKFDQSEP